MSKSIKYLNDRSFDNLLLIFMHTYMDLVSLSNQNDISKNYLVSKIDCLEEVYKAYFRSTKISKREWDGFRLGLGGGDLEHEFDWFMRTLIFCQELYYKLEEGSNISEDDPIDGNYIIGLKNCIRDCVSLLEDPPFSFYKWNPIFDS